MNATVELVNASGSRVPAKRLFVQWAEAALKGAGYRNHCTLSLRLVGEAEGSALNGKYRSKAYATNVLSFPVPTSMHTLGQLGDIALCTAVVKREAREQGKKTADHWAHLVIHGVLHLLGYDHERQKDANIMEALETRVLAKLGIKDPYHQ